MTTLKLVSKLKNIFSFFSQKKIKRFFLVFFLFSVLLIFPLSTKAGLEKWFKLSLVVAILYLVGAVAYVFAILADFAFGLVKWIISPDFISWSYTNPANNDLIRIGLETTQSLVNIILVLALIYIALATILQLENFQTKKALKNFVIIALLVNFSPVICGVIVDASNIVMNFFLGYSRDMPQAHLASSIFWEKVRNIAGTSWVADWSVAFQIAWSGVVMAALAIPVYIIMFIVYVIFALLFIFRRVAIWILVILSPIAFGFYILPVTKKYWDMWWKQFIQWCFVGATGAFFLYLSGQFTTQLNQVTNQPTTKTSITTQTKVYAQQTQKENLPFKNKKIEKFLAALPVKATNSGSSSPIISDDSLDKFKANQKSLRNNYTQDRTHDAFLLALQGVLAGVLGIISLYATFSTGAIGASVAVGLAKGNLGRVGGGFKKAGKWLGYRAGRGVGRYAEEKLKTREIAGEMAKKVERTPVLRHFLPQRLKDYGEFRPAIDKEIERLKNESPETRAHKLIKGVAKGREAAAELVSLANSKKTQSLFDSAKKNIKELKGASDEEVLQNETFQKITREALYAARKGGYLDDIIGQDPRLAAILAGQKWAGDQFAKVSSQEAISLAVQQAKPADIAKWNTKVLENKDVVKSMLNHFDRNRWLQVQRNITNGQETALKTIDKLTEEAGGWDQLMEQVGKERKYELALQSPVFRANGWREGRIGEKGAPGERLIKTPEELKEEERKKQRKSPRVGEGEGEKRIFLP